MSRVTVPENETVIGSNWERNAVRTWAAISLGGALRDIPKKRLRRRLSVNVHWEVRSISFPAPPLLLSGETGAGGSGMIQLLRLRGMSKIDCYRSPWAPDCCHDFLLYGEIPQRFGLRSWEVREIWTLPKGSSVWVYKEFSVQLRWYNPYPFDWFREVSHLPNVAVCIELLSFQNGSIVDYCQINRKWNRF